MYGLRGIPHIIAEGNTSLVGELYLVDEDDFWPIDEIEGGYDRLPIELEDGTQALAYFGEKSWSRENDIVTTGDWMCNQNSTRARFA